MLKRMLTKLAIATACIPVTLAVQATGALASSFNLTQTFANPTPAAGDFFGASALAIDGDRVLIGASFDDTGAADSGAVYLFDTNGTLLQTFLNPTPAANDLFGNSVAIDGDNILITAFFDDAGGTDSGAAYLFDAITGDLLHTFLNPNLRADDQFGSQVAIEGNRILLSARADDTGTVDSGFAYLFDIDGNLLQTFANPTPDAGDFFGSAVGIEGDNIVIGAFLDDTGATNSGAAYVFDANTGDLLHTLLNPSPEGHDTFGNVLDISEGKIIIGAGRDNTAGRNTGLAYLFDAETGDLLHTFANPTPEVDDFFGNKVAIEGDLVLLSAAGDKMNGMYSGAAYLFDTDGNLLQSFFSPMPDPNDLFGDEVDISGNTLVIGARFGDAGGTNSGSAHLFQRSSVPEPGMVIGLGAIAIAGCLRRKKRVCDAPAERLRDRNR